MFNMFFQKKKKNDIQEHRYRLLERDNLKFKFEILSLAALRSDSARGISFPGN